MVGPPAAPTQRIGVPSLVTRVGVIDDSGRLPGATALANAPTRPNALGAPGCAEKSSILSLSTTPETGSTTRTPKSTFTVIASATTFPSPSATHRFDVP